VAPSPSPYGDSLTPGSELQGRHGSGVAATVTSHGELRVVLTRRAKHGKFVAHAALFPLALASGAAQLGAQRADAIVDSSGVVTGRLVDATDSQPVPYGTVLVLGTGHASFADGTGTYRMARLSPGTYVLRARQIGYAPRDTTVQVAPAPSVTTVTMYLSRIPAILSLVTVEGRRSKGCTVTGIPDSASDPRLAAVMTQVQENVDRFRLLVEKYPFRYAREERMVLRLDPGGDFTDRVDTVVYESRGDRPYQVGGVVQVDSDTTAHARHYMYLPTFSALGDSTFLSAHCFTFGGTETPAGRRGAEVMRVDFRPANAIKAPDVEGSIYVDVQRLVVRRAVFRLTKPEASHPRVLGVAVTTAFREFVPLVPVFDSVESVTRLPPGPPPAGPHSAVVRGAGPATPGAEAPVDRTLVERYHVLDFAFETRTPGEQESPGPPSLPGLPNAIAATSSSPTASAVTDTTAPPTLLTGRVVQSGGKPVPGATIGLLGQTDTVTADDDGDFTLPVAEAGAYMVTIRRLGYRPERIAVTLSAGRPRELAITLTRLVPVLPTVTTTAAERSAYRDVGFQQRLQAGIGEFLTYEQIQQKHAPQFTELLRGSHTVRVVHRPRQFDNALVGTRMTKGAPACVSLVVDGVPQPLRDEYSAAGTLIGSESPDGILDVSNIGAVEVYQQSERPVGFGSALDWCDLVMVWTTTRLGLGGSAAPTGEARTGDAIQGRGVLTSDSSCTPPTTPDTMDFGVYATLQGTPGRQVSNASWSHYVDSVLSIIDRWSVLPSTVTLGSFGPAFTKPKEENSSSSVYVAPTLASVFVFTLDSLGTLTSARVAASSLAGEADTSVLASLARAATAHGFPATPLGAGSARFDLVVSSLEPAPDTRASVLGRLEVPIWPLTHAVTAASDSAAGSTRLATRGTASVELVIDGRGQVVAGTERALQIRGGAGRANNDNDLGVRIGQQLRRLRFEPARIGGCRVADLVSQSIGIPEE
jgi:hypothetical protein